MPKLITSTPAARFSAILRSSCAKAYGGMRSKRFLGLIKLLCELVAEAPLAPGPRPACQVDVQVLPHLYLQLAAVEHDGHTSVLAGEPGFEHVGDRRSGGARARGQGLADAALEDASADALALAPLQTR